MTAPIDEPVLHCDLALARRLERAEGKSCARFVETRAALFPDSGARWIEVAGAYAMYDGPRSPITQTFGLGLFQPVTPADLEVIEKFYQQRGAPVYHEVSPLADVGLLAVLTGRGYRPIELTSVMIRPVRGGPPPPISRYPRIRVRRIHEGEHDLWARTAAQGWSEIQEPDSSFLELMRISVKRLDGLTFLAELEEQPIAAAVMILHEGVALLAGASTVPAYRKQGAQLALLEARLRHAAEQKCDLTMMCALPGSGSQRNAERQGFRVAYTRIKWQRIQPAPECGTTKASPGS
jgi:hypothetical protein